MSTFIRRFLLVITIALIIASIVFLESRKIHVAESSAGGDTINVNATSTAVSPHTPDFTARLKQYPPAKELVSPDAYINTGGTPISIRSLVGKKIVLVDFWTYSCINCERSIPYLNAWYIKYKDAGLEIIGVHSPEFEFEKRLDNVQTAVAKFGIRYPVVLDSEMRTWNAYGNRYWPEHYLIDINGLVVDRHIGEGGYEETEAKIRQLLAERAIALDAAASISSSTVRIAQSIETNSPETYFGAARNEYLANGMAGKSGSQTLVRPASGSIEANRLYLVGAWDFKDQYARNQSADARIIYRYEAKNVYLVANSENGAEITVLRDGVPVAAQKGDDVGDNSVVSIHEARLYKLISEKEMGAHTLEIIIKDPGLDVYTFTFG